MKLTKAQLVSENIELRRQLSVQQVTVARASRAQLPVHMERAKAFAIASGKTVKVG